MVLLSLTAPASFVLFLPPQNRLQTLNLALTPSPIFCNFLRTPCPNYPRTVKSSRLSGETSSSVPIRIEEIVERDWSFLDVDMVNSDEERRRKTRLAISASRVEDGSRVLVCMGNEWFVDRLMESDLSFDLLLVIHESLFALAMMKEKYDGVRCWQGEITALPQKFSQFDAVFVCYFPGMGLPLDQLLSAVAPRCSPGARLLISFDQGKQVVEGSHRQQYPDMVTSGLPERTVLENAAAIHSFRITEFIDEATFYLAVLTFIG